MTFSELPAGALFRQSEQRRIWESVFFVKRPTDEIQYIIADERKRMMSREGFKHAFLSKIAEYIPSEEEKEK